MKQTLYLQNVYKADTLTLTHAHTVIHRTGIRNTVRDINTLQTKIPKKPSSTQATMTKLTGMNRVRAKGFQCRDPESRDPGPFSQSRIPGLRKQVRDWNPYPCVDACCSGLCLPYNGRTEFSCWHRRAENAVHSIVRYFRKLGNKMHYVQSNREQSRRREWPQTHTQSSGVPRRGLRWVRTPPLHPLAYNLRNKRARMRQNMVFLTKNTKKFLDRGTDPSLVGNPPP